MSDTHASLLAQTHFELRKLQKRIDDAMRREKALQKIADAAAALLSEEDAFDTVSHFNAVYALRDALAEATMI